MSGEPSRDEIAAAFRVQARGCADHGSAIYASLIEAAAQDLERGGKMAEVVAGWRGHPVLDALSLRILGGVHRLVMEGSAPGLARHYPSVGGVPDEASLLADFAALVEARVPELREAAHEPVQTNEVSRTAALLPGFLRVAATTGLPLRLLELGSSAGLLQLADRFRYELGPHRWGDPVSAVMVQADWEGPRPDLEAALRVTARSGCDPRPIDVRDAVQFRRLASFVWPEQTARLHLLRTAQRAARFHPPQVEASGGADFLRRELARPQRGVATLVFQSVMWWYVSGAERAEITRLVTEAGARATSDAPLAWLRMEAGLSDTEVRLWSWPGGEDALLARAQYHGRWVRWLAPRSGGA
jgi:hypothetical protein